MPNNQRDFLNYAQKTKNPPKKRHCWGRFVFLLLGSSVLTERREWHRRNDSLVRSRPGSESTPDETAKQQHLGTTAGSIIESMLGLWAAAPDICFACLGYLKLLSYVNRAEVFLEASAPRTSHLWNDYWFGKWIQDGGMGDDTAGSLVMSARINDARMHNMCSEECGGRNDCALVDRCLFEYTKSTGSTGFAWQTEG